MQAKQLTKRADALTVEGRRTRLSWEDWVNLVGLGRSGEQERGMGEWRQEGKLRRVVEMAVKQDQ